MDVGGADEGCEGVCKGLRAWIALICEYFVVLFKLDCKGQVGFIHHL